MTELERCGSDPYSIGRASSSGSSVAGSTADQREPAVQSDDFHGRSLRNVSTTSYLISENADADADSQGFAKAKSPAATGLGVLRRNNSMPSMVCGDDDDDVILPRNRSADTVLYDEASEADSMLIEVDGKMVLAPQFERLCLKSNPYVGNFHYGHQASKKLSGYKISPPQEPQKGCVSASPMLAAQKSPAIVGFDSNLRPAPVELSDHDEGLAAGSPLQSPIRRPPSKVASMSRSNSGPDMSRNSSGQSLPRNSSGQSLPRSNSITLQDRENMKQALQLQSSVPADPEMCGLQALLPRQAGMQVQYTVGEGSFGKCVKVLNRKNRQEWSTATSKRGISRHLNEIPLEGESLVIKYIKKDDPAELAKLYSGIDADVLLSAIQREIRIHGKCNHVNIVRLFGHYELGSKVGLILGFVEGAELHDLLHIKRKLPEAECFLIMLQMMRATQYMHEMHIIHRDLKPRNVLVSSLMRVHVIDLGLAIDMSDPLDLQKAAHQVVGTQGYMAPESLREEKATFAIDMWALGVMFYEMVFGFSPFLAHEVMLPTAVEFPDPSWGILVSAELEDLVGKLLNKDDKQRILAAAALEHAWFETAHVAAADLQLGDARVEERAKVAPSVRQEFAEEVIETAKKCLGSRDGLERPNEENEDSNIDQVYNAQFSYAYYHAIIIEGGRNDLD